MSILKKKLFENLVVANVVDSRAGLATISDDGSLILVQLTLDFKPNIPQEAERVVQCNGRVFCLDDERVHRVWLPNEESPGLAMSRAFGDYCLKDFGLISVPQVTRRQITVRDQFIVLASDGGWTDTMTGGRPPASGTRNYKALLCRIDYDFYFVAS
ncbi:hypothetical protein DCAR_0727972 [Daucus carota subsp. sativus]|uniref:PPM-type phosphatase domain-containing protein n=1 Tax=Daucus carota subsp. sativus TaxID=79200 RepID=A0A161ZLR6_DAUCS|nr:hypothetical protein DCAR_0727972 [Daucus carota subsp. sativus]